MITDKACVYVGLAGETEPGRLIQSGLYRMPDGAGEWESMTNGLPEAPAIRAIAIHPHKPKIVYVGTQDGPYRSTDYGDHWEKVPVPDQGRPVWSVLFHPRNPDVIYAGYESCDMYRTEDGGDNWYQLPVIVRFPEATMVPRANPARRILMMASSIADPNLLYAAVEVGGVIRSLDGGEHWENLSHGLYLNDDLVDMHGVLVSNMSTGMVYSISRSGLFRSTDRGDHWLHVPLEPLNTKGHTYCRTIRQVPGDPKTIWVAAGAEFQGDVGALFRSIDGGTSWERVEMGFQLTSTMFCIAFDERQSKRMYCATYGGQVFGSYDCGQSWSSYPLPEGAFQVYSSACG